MATSSPENQHKHTNRLIHESSPYLLQHAHNPVNWYAWGEEAWQRARDENKLVIVSIGYSACHWCHVMERESFEDETVAKWMNDHYICIKVDREERQDVDQLYMDACNIMIGRGGWPLNAFALPDGRPVYAGTYFPKNRWMGLLHEIGGGYKKKPQNYIEYAEKLIAGIKALNLIEIPETEPSAVADKAILRQAYEHFVAYVDREHGGRGQAPKFPIPDNWLFLLRYHHLTKDVKALEYVELTLDKMALGGIYDQLGGGFARYSVDEQWHVPHFEKMLYDNAQLLSLYAEAYQLTQKPLYKQVVYETVEWLKRELLSPEGGFFSALDADSEGEEGKFYVWTKEEVDALLSQEDAMLIFAHYGLNGYSLWEEGKNNLRVERSVAELAPLFNMTEEQATDRIGKARKFLLEAREKRVRPGLDDKVLLSWNALTVKGLLDCYAAFGEEGFLQLAEQNLQFLRKNLVQGNQLYRTWKKGKAAIPAFLEDYAFYIHALIHLYQVSFDENLLHEARTLTDYVLKEYIDEKSGLFYFTSAANNELVARKIDTSDNVIPSPNSVMAQNLFLLGKIFDIESYLQHAERMLHTIKPNLAEHAAFFCNWGKLLCYITGSFYEVAIVGEQHRKQAKLFSQKYLPNKILLGSKDENSGLPLLQNRFVPGKTMIYVCYNKTCSLPVENVEDAWKQTG